MEELFTTLGTVSIIVLILALLPYIAIIGTWIEISKTRKSIEEISEILITQSKIIDMRTLEIQTLQKNNYVSNDTTSHTDVYRE